MKIKIITGITFLLLVLFASCQSDDNIEFDRLYSTGSLVYQTRCQNCHGAHGEGLQRLIPPLTDSIYLKNNKDQLACSIKFGLKGQIVISKRTFEGQMPANDLAPIEIAEVLTYINNSFGNKGGTISSNQVQAGLQKCR